MSLPCPLESQLDERKGERRAAETRALCNHQPSDEKDDERRKHEKWEAEWNMIGDISRDEPSAGKGPLSWAPDALRPERTRCSHTHRFDTSDKPSVTGNMTNSDCSGKKYGFCDTGNGSQVATHHEHNHR